jgi:hypothetical protein
MATPEGITPGAAVVGVGAGVGAVVVVDVGAVVGGTELVGGAESGGDGFPPPRVSAYETAPAATKRISAPTKIRLRL